MVEKGRREEVIKLYSKGFRRQKKKKTRINKITGGREVGSRRRKDEEVNRNTMKKRFEVVKQQSWNKFASLRVIKE